MSIHVIYTNWEGETREREIIPTGLVRYGTSKWHPEPGWLLEAEDAETGQLKEFSLSTCNFVTGT